jgi:hypothetical protein
LSRNRDLTSPGAKSHKLNPLYDSVIDVDQAIALKMRHWALSRDNAELASGIGNQAGLFNKK